MSVEKISLSLPSELLAEIDLHVNNNNISRSAFFKDMSKQWFLKKMEKDLKDLSKMKFDDLPNEDDWLIIQNECDKYED